MLPEIEEPPPIEEEEIADLLSSFEKNSSFEGLMAKTDTGEKTKEAESKKKKEGETEKKEASPEELVGNVDDYIIQEPEDSELLQPEMATINYAVISFCRYFLV